MIHVEHTNVRLDKLIFDNIFNNLIVTYVFALYIIKSYFLRKGLF